MKVTILMRKLRLRETAADILKQQIGFMAENESLPVIMGKRILMWGLLIMDMFFT